MLYFIVGVLLVLVVMGLILNNYPKDELQKENEGDILKAKSQISYKEPIPNHGTKFRLPLNCTKEVLPTIHNKEVLVFILSPDNKKLDIRIINTRLVWEEYDSKTNTPTGYLEPYSKDTDYNCIPNQSIRSNASTNKYYKLIWYNSEKYYYWIYPSDLTTLVSYDLAKRGIYDRPEI